MLENEILNMIEKLKALEIKKIDTFTEKQENNVYLTKTNLDQYKQQKMNEKCIKCTREPKYINRDSKELFCWNHCIS